MKDGVVGLKILILQLLHVGLCNFRSPARTDLKTVVYCTPVKLHATDLDTSHLTATLGIEILTSLTRL